MITLIALSISVSPQEGTPLDTYLLHVPIPKETPVAPEKIGEEIRLSGKFEIIEVKKDPIKESLDFLLRPLSVGKIPLFLGEVSQGLYIKINPLPQKTPPLPPLLSMSATFPVPLPEKEAHLWQNYLDRQPEINQRLYEEKQFPWRTLLLFLGLLLTLPYLFRLFYTHILLPLSYVSPEEKALKEIDRLRHKPLERERFFDLSHLLRKFYAQRYAIEASHMTFDELQESLQKSSKIEEKEKHLALLQKIEQQKFIDPFLVPPPSKELYEEAEQIIKRRDT